MSTYKAYLCYKDYFDEDDLESSITIRFEEPSRYEYSLVIPIQFSILKQLDNIQELLNEI